ncbi:MAG: flagellar protein FlaG [Gammaproteobacteria bacterium]|nr:flagellar protein FlaG [Gammaproteobacteria bacterium]
MNEIKAQNSAAQAASSLTSAPQVQAPKQDAKVKAEAVKSVQDSGEKLPPNAQQTAEARSVEVKEAVSKLNEYVQKTQRDLDFQLDEDSGKTVIRVYDRHSEQLVRQIPDEAALEMAKKLSSEEPLVLFNAQI